MGSATSNSRNVDNNQFGDNATINLGDIQNEVNYILQRRETPPQPSQLIPFPRDPDFISRGDILDQISARCLEPAGRVALVGLGGVGKSQLAIEFAHRFAEEHSDVWLFWIHAATQARVEEGFRLIADAVKLPERKEPKADILLLVKNWLSIEPNGKWIIILDSADDNEVLYNADESVNNRRPLATYIPKSRNGSIILTTRNRGLAAKLTGGHKYIIDVDTMSETDALTLLERKMESSLSTLEGGLAKDLVKALECIPLAISQAAAYIQAMKPRCSIEKYLAEFRKSERESMRLLKHEANDIGRDEETSNTVLRTWTISFEYIRSHRPSAAGLLSLMSFFDRQGIPGWIFIDSTAESNSLEETESSGSEAGEDSDEDIKSMFEEDILILRNFCLIAVNAEGDVFEMHRLVQLSIKSWLKAFGMQETFMQRFITRMADYFPTAEYENWGICQDLFAHVQAALDCRPNEDTLEDWAALCYGGGFFAFVQGKYHIAEQMVKKSKKAREKKYGKDGALTLQSTTLLAAIISTQGRWDEAEELQVQVMDIHKANLGDDHPDTITSISNLAATYSSQGRWDEAEKIEVQVMETRKAQFGVNHPDTASSMDKLAVTYVYQGRWDEAEKLQTEALKARETRLGTNHPDTLGSMSNLASTYSHQDRWEEAEKLETQVLETRKSILGADHPDTLLSMNKLGSIYCEQGQWDKAEELQTQALEAHETTLGTDHPETLFSMGGLASTYFQQGRLDEAENLGLKVMEAAKMKLGLDHPETLTSMNNLAMIWKKQGRHEDALALMIDCLQVRQRVLGLQHPDTLGTSEWIEVWSNGSEQEYMYSLCAT